MVRAQARPSLVSPVGIVEHTFGWLNRWRRLSKDCERTTGSSKIIKAGNSGDQKPGPGADADRNPGLTPKPGADAETRG
jgi:hypothetical protein